MRSRILGCGLFLLVIAATPTTAFAQGAARTSLDGEAIRAFLIASFEQAKLMHIDMARSIPDSAMRWGPSDEVRDFAEQVEHAANSLWLETFLSGGSPESPGDSAVYLNDKDALVEAVTRWNDWMLESIRTLPADDFFVERRFFTGENMERWRLYHFALDHAYWTLGQLVGYFRAHGLTPPQYRFY
jgi:hypothetical protein